MFSIFRSVLNCRNRSRLISSSAVSGTIIGFLFLCAQLCQAQENWNERSENRYFNKNEYNVEESMLDELSVLMTNQFRTVDKRLLYLENKFDNILRHIEKDLNRVERKVAKLTTNRTEKSHENFLNLLMNFTLIKDYTSNQENSVNESSKQAKMLSTKKINGTDLYTGIYYQIGMKSFPGGCVTLSNQTVLDQVSNLIIDNDTPCQYKYQWRFEETEIEGWYTLRNLANPNGLATWSSTKRGSGYHISMIINQYETLGGGTERGNVLWRPESSDQKDLYSLKMKDFPLGVVTWTYDKYNAHSHYLIVATKAEDMVNYLSGEKWYDDKLFSFQTTSI